MKLLVVSHTPHYRTASGRLEGWGATVRELDRLASLFDRLVHLAPIYAEAPPSSSLPYQSSRIELRGLPAVGGDRWRDKFQILTSAPGFYAELRRAFREVDAVHVRAPANVALLTMASFRTLPSSKPWWFKYAGNWHSDGIATEARSYRLQRRWLAKKRNRVAVTVNGRRSEDGDHVYGFLNPCLTQEELAIAQEIAQQKPIDGPLELLFVGRLDGFKGADRALRVIETLKRDGVEARLTLAGDGPQRLELERLSCNLGLGERTSFRGWLPRSELNLCYARAHGLLLPSRASEGWPKVLSEAMAHGALVLTSQVSCVPQVLDELGQGERIGWAFDADDIDGFASAARDLTSSKTNFRVRSRRASQAAEAFTYSRYLDRVQALFQNHLQMVLSPQDSTLAI